jgi:hypothetical protein
MNKYAYPNRNHSSSPTAINQDDRHTPHTSMSIYPMDSHSPSTNARHHSDPRTLLLDIFDYPNRILATCTISPHRGVPHSPLLRPYSHPIDIRSSPPAIGAPPDALPSLPMHKSVSDPIYIHESGTIATPRDD